MRVLIIEDERKTAQYLKKGLSEQGFNTDVAENGEDGLHLALTGEYTFIILDVMLPDRDGWSIFFRNLRIATSTTFVSQSKNISQTCSEIYVLVNTSPE
jgi:two-component system copper resistance phosphate regulon response regulator CusR